MIPRQKQALLLATLAWFVGGCAAAPRAPEPATLQLPTTAQAGGTTVVAVGPPAAPCCKQTLPEFLGITGLAKLACSGLDRLRNRLGMVFPGLEPGPPVLAITDPANSGADQPPAVQAAAAVKADEDAAAQKIKAIRYLAGVGCGGCYPDVEAALLAALDDCTEAVRYEAVKALRSTAGNPCQACRANSCCGPKILKGLKSLAYDTTDSGCYKEPSARVRRIARLAMNACGGTVPIDNALPEEGPSETIDAPPAEPQAVTDNQPLTFAAALTSLRSAPSQPLSPSGGVLRGAVAAKVNGELIFWDEILARVQSAPADATIAGNSPRASVQETAFRDELHRAIDHRLLSQEARRRMPPDEIARLLYEDAQGNAAAELEGRMPNAPRGSAQDEILAGEWVRRCVHVSEELSRQEMYDYYRANFERYSEPGFIRWEQLTATLDRFASREQAEVTLSYVRAKTLGANPEWSPDIHLEAIETVRREAASIAGLPEGVLRRVLATLPLGQISPIVQDAEGLHLVRVLQRSEPRTRPLDEVADRVRQDVIQQGHSRAIQAHLQSLRHQADVWIAPVAQTVGEFPVSQTTPAASSLPRHETNSTPAREPIQGREASGRAPAPSRQIVSPPQSCNCH